MMIDEQHVFYGRLQGDEPGFLDRLRELQTPRDIRTPSVTSVISAYMRSRGDIVTAEVFELAVTHVLNGRGPSDAIEALIDLVFFYADTDCDMEDEDSPLRYLQRVFGMSESGPRIASVSAVRLTAQDRRLLDVMMRYDKRATFAELRDAWHKEVQESAIVKALKRLKKRLPRSQWDFEISEANWEIVWHKKGQIVP